MQLDLSDRQKIAVGSALTILSAAVIVSAVGVVCYLLAWFLSAFSQVFLPLAVAGVAALVFQPYFALLRKRLPPAAALVALFLSVLIPVVAFSWFFGAIIVDQVQDLVDKAPAFWNRVVKLVQERWPRVIHFLQDNPVGQRLRDAASDGQGKLVQGLEFFGGKALSAGAGILRGVAALLNWAVLPIYFAFFLMAEPRRVAGLESHLPFLKEDTRRDFLYLVREFVNIVVAFFRGQLIIAFLQGLLMAIGFSLVGLRYGFVLGLLLGLLNVIPYLGSIIGLGITLPLAFFQVGGGMSRLIAVVVVFAIVQMIEGYLLTPKIMGDRTGLHPVAIIVSVFFWGSALSGILGMILAIPLTAFLVVFWRLAKEKYIGELV